MVLPVVDDNHQELKKMVHIISAICLSDEFLALRQELEEIYIQGGADQVHAPFLAFEDALYALMAQEEQDEEDGNQRPRIKA